MPTKKDKPTKPPETANDPPGNGEEDQEDQDDGVTYDEWLKSQPDEIQEMLNTHTSGLKTALTKERDARGELETKVRDLAGKAEKGSKAEQELTDLADDLATQNRKTAFYEDAFGEGVTNLKYAFIVAEEEGLFDKRGNCNFAALREGFPELFGGKPTTPPANPGSGGNNNPRGGPKKSMDSWIRRKSGRG